MAMSKSTNLVLLALVMLLLLELDLQGGPKVIGADAINCGGRCMYRCSKASRRKICIRACNTCCRRCHCVPPGTYGNTHVCPCYARMKTHGGRLKCP